MVKVLKINVFTVTGEEYLGGTLQSGNKLEQLGVMFTPGDGGLAVIFIPWHQVKKAEMYHEE